MSDRAVHYHVKIICVHVPEALKEIPLPVEIISQAGEATYSLIIVREKETWMEAVKAPGNYLVRTELPSGQSIAETVIVPEPRGAGHGASGEVRLDFGFEEFTTLDVFNEYDRFGLKREDRQRRIFQTFDKFLPSRVGAVRKPPAFRRYIRAARSLRKHMSLEYGLFIGWNPYVFDDDSASSVNTLMMRKKGTASTYLPGEIALQQHPGWSQESKQWRPLLVRVRLLSSELDVHSVEALLIWPPSVSPLPRLNLLSDPHLEGNLDAPPLLAFLQSEDRTVDALFSFIRSGGIGCGATSFANTGRTDYESPQG